MNDLALESRVQRFQDKFLKEEKINLPEEGLATLHSLLYDSNYRKMEGVYVRPKEDLSVEIFAEDDFKPEKKGYTYVQIQDLGKIKEFMTAAVERRQLPSYNDDNITVGMVGIGASGLGVGALISVAVSSFFPLLLALPAAVGGGYLGKIGSDKNHKTILENKKKSDAEFDAKYTLITGKDAILKALIPEYHPE